MSSFTVTIVGTTAEPESAFLMHVVQEAVKAYRHHRDTSDGLGDTTNDVETTGETPSIHLVTR